MQIVFKIHKQFSLSTNSQPNSKMCGYIHEDSVRFEVSMAVYIKCFKLHAFDPIVLNKTTRLFPLNFQKTSFMF